MFIWDYGLKESSLNHAKDQIRLHHISANHIRTSSCRIGHLQQKNCRHECPTQICMARVFLADLMSHAVRRSSAHAQPELFLHC